MGLIDTEALVLRTYNLAEADKIVVCLTKCCGTVRGVAHGARRLKSRFGAALEPFTLIDLTYFEKEERELVSLKGVEIKRSFFDSARDAETLEAMARIAELALEFAPPHEPNETLFRLVRASLNALGQTPGHSTSIGCYFEVWLLKFSGFLPQTDVCAVCRRPLRDTEHSYMNAENKVRCESCSHAQGTQMRADGRALLRAIKTLPPNALAGIWHEFGEETREETMRFTRRLLDHTLERHT